MRRRVSLFDYFVLLKQYGNKNNIIVLLQLQIHYIIIICNYGLYILDDVTIRYNRLIKE